MNQSKHIEEVVSNMSNAEVSDVSINLMNHQLRKAQMNLSMWKAMVESTESHISTINHVINKIKDQTL